MAAVTTSIEVDRSPETTYAYATDPTLFRMATGRQRRNW
jgi:hypothetical protein